MGLFASCAPSTPQSRIQQRPQDFERLSERHKQLVVRGEIDGGMSKDAVAIAWGSPSARIDGMRNGEMTERWDYLGQRAVRTNRFFGGISTGYSGPYRYSGYNMGVAPEVEYIPYVKSSVWFKNGLVDEWERQR